MPLLKGRSSCAPYTGGSSRRLPPQAACLTAVPLRCMYRCTAAGTPRTWCTRPCTTVPPWRCPAPWAPGAAPSACRNTRANNKPQLCWDNGPGSIRHCCCPRRRFGITKGEIYDTFIQHGWSDSMSVDSGECLSLRRGGCSAPKPFEPGPAGEFAPCRPSSWPCSAACTAAGRRRPLPVAPLPGCVCVPAVGGITQAASAKTGGRPMVADERRWLANFLEARWGSQLHTALGQTGGGGRLATGRRASCMLCCAVLCCAVLCCGPVPDRRVAALPPAQAGGPGRGPQVAGRHLPSGCIPALPGPRQPGAQRARQGERGLWPGRRRRRAPCSSLPCFFRLEEPSLLLLLRAPPAGHAAAPHPARRLLPLLVAQAAVTSC